MGFLIFIGIVVLILSCIKMPPSKNSGGRRRNGVKLPPAIEKAMGKKRRRNRF